MATLYENNIISFPTSDPFFNNALLLDSSEWGAMAGVLVSVSHTITEIKLRLARITGFLPGTITLSIRTASLVTGYYLPSNGSTDLASASVNGNSLIEVDFLDLGSFTSYDLVTFTFPSPITVNAGNRYALCLRSSASSGDYSLIWPIDDTSTDVVGNCAHSINSGSTWSYGGGFGYQNYDAYFEIYGDPSAPDLAGTIPSSSSLSGGSILPAQAANPTPASASTGINSYTKQVTWENGGEATTYNVYTNFGVPGLEPILVAADVVDAATVIYNLVNALDYGVTYKWRIDAKMGDAIKYGTVWTFTTHSNYGYSRPSDYDSDLIWQEDPDTPGTWGWFSLDTTGGGRFKDQIVIVGHKTIYFGDL